jgi:hypothetical protein
MEAMPSSVSVGSMMAVAVNKSNVSNGASCDLGEALLSLLCCYVTVTGRRRHGLDGLSDKDGLSLGTNITTSCVTIVAPTF